MRFQTLFVIRMIGFDSFPPGQTGSRVPGLDDLSDLPEGAVETVHQGKVLMIEMDLDRQQSVTDDIL